MLKTVFISYFERDLTTLKNELELYTNEQHLWLTDTNIKNSAGNLCLHLIGNLNHFIGAVLGKTGYVRERDKEFTEKQSLPELITRVEKTKTMLTEVLTNLTHEQYEGLYPILFLEKEISTSQMLLQLSTHLNYHLGQINYHRRLLDKKN